MSNPICPEPGCGRKMQNACFRRDMPDAWYCSATPDQHRIAALESALRLSEDRVEEVRDIACKSGHAIFDLSKQLGMVNEDRTADYDVEPERKAIADLQAKLSESEAARRELEAYKDRLRAECVGSLTDAGACMLVDTDPCAPGEVSRAIREIVRAAETRANKAESNLRALAAHCAALRKALKESRRTHEMWEDVAPAVSLCADIDKLLSTSPDAIQRSVEEGIRREALEQAWAVVDAFCANGQLNITREEAYRLREEILGTQPQEGA